MRQAGHPDRGRRHQTPADAEARLAAGATLLQAYTAFIYQGPFWPSSVQRGLAARLRSGKL